MPSSTPSSSRPRTPPTATSGPPRRASSDSPKPAIACCRLATPSRHRSPRRSSHRQSRRRQPRELRRAHPARRRARRPASPAGAHPAADQLSLDQALAHDLHVDEAAAIGNLAQARNLTPVYERASSLTTQPSPPVALTTDPVEKIELQYTLASFARSPRRPPGRHPHHRLRLHAPTLASSASSAPPPTSTPAPTSRNAPSPRCSKPQKPPRPDLARDFTLEAATRANDASDPAQARTLALTPPARSSLRPTVLAIIAASYARANDDAGLKTFYLARIDAARTDPGLTPDDPQAEHRPAPPRPHPRTHPLAGLPRRRRPVHRPALRLPRGLRHRASRPPSTPSAQPPTAAARLPSHHRSAVPAGLPLRHPPRPDRDHLRRPPGCRSRLHPAIAIRKDRADLYTARADLELRLGQSDPAQARARRRRLQPPLPAHLQRPRMDGPPRRAARPPATPRRRRQRARDRLHHRPTPSRRTMSSPSPPSSTSGTSSPKPAPSPSRASPSPAPTSSHSTPSYSFDQTAHRCRHLRPHPHAGPSRGSARHPGRRPPRRATLPASPSVLAAKLGAGKTSATPKPRDCRKTMPSSAARPPPSLPSAVRSHRYRRPDLLHPGTEARLRPGARPPPRSAQPQPSPARTAATSAGLADREAAWRKQILLTGPANAAPTQQHLQAYTSSNSAASPSPSSPTPLKPSLPASSRRSAAPSCQQAAQAFRDAGDETDEARLDRSLVLADNTGLRDRFFDLLLRHDPSRTRRLRRRQERLARRRRRQLRRRPRVGSASPRRRRPSRPNAPRRLAPRLRIPRRNLLRYAEIPGTTASDFTQSLASDAIHRRSPRHTAPTPPDSSPATTSSSTPAASASSSPPSPEPPRCLTPKTSFPPNSNSPPPPRHHTSTSPAPTLKPATSPPPSPSTPTPSNSPPTTPPSKTRPPPSSTAPTAARSYRPLASALDILHRMQQHAIYPESFFASLRSHHRSPRRASPHRIAPPRIEAIIGPISPATATTAPTSCSKPSTAPRDTRRGTALILALANSATDPTSVLEDLRRAAGSTPTPASHPPPPDRTGTAIARRRSTTAPPPACAVYQTDSARALPGSPPGRQGPGALRLHPEHILAHLRRTT